MRKTEETDRYDKQYLELFETNSTVNFPWHLIQLFSPGRGLSPIIYLISSVFQPQIDSSSYELFKFGLKPDEIYKVWPRHQSLSAFVQSRAEQLFAYNAANFFLPLKQVCFASRSIIILSSNSLNNFLK